MNFPKVQENVSKNYEIADDVDIKSGLSNKLHLSKNIFSLNEEQEQQYASLPKGTCKDKFPIPHEMSSAFIRYMLIYRIIAFLTILSMLISGLTVYWDGLETQLLIIINNGISLSTLCAILFRLRLYIEFNRTKNNQRELQWQLSDFMDLVLIVPHSTLWTQEVNYFFHLFVMLRIIIPIKYFIYSSVFCNIRAYRIITIYGLNSKEHFLFAVKSLVAELSVIQILTVECISVTFFTHGLYLTSILGNYPMNWMDCFEVVIVSMPTVGFGEYNLPYLGQKIIVVIMLIMGAVLNSFIIFTMISELNMDGNEESSYWLMQKVKTREQIQDISQNYIRKSLENIRDKNRNLEKANINFSFKTQYRRKKNLYNSITYTDINNLFAYFRETLKDLRIRTTQTNNMILLLVRHLRRQNFKRDFLSQ